jgi:hypothetical protein
VLESYTHTYRFRVYIYLLEFLLISPFSYVSSLIWEWGLMLAYHREGGGALLVALVADNDCVVAIHHSVEEDKVAFVVQTTAALVAETELVLVVFVLLDLVFLLRRCQ